MNPFFLWKFPFRIYIFLLLLFFSPTFLFSATTVTVGGPSSATPGKPGVVGLGLSLGAPTALDFQYSLSNEHFLHMDLGTGYSAIVFLGDYHFTLLQIRFQNAPLLLPLTVGVGGIVGGGEGPIGRENLLMVGVRVPFSAELWFLKIPLSIFLEIAPQITTALPKGFLGLQLGVRFHFVP